MRRSSPSQHPAESPPASFRAESDANTALRSLQLRSPQPSPPTTPSKRTSSQASLRRSESISNNPALASSRRGSSEEQQLQQGELPATSSSSPTAPASLKATTTATANTAAVTPAGEQATSARNDSRRKSRSRERDVEEDTYSAHQRRLYRPEVRSCGHPQPIVLKVPVGQGSPDLLVSPSLASQLTTSTTAASLMTTPELSPKKSAAAIHARPPSAPASPSAKTSVSPSVLSSAITNAESIAATTVLNAAARSPPYAAESARVSNATESLAEQPLCPPTALPTTPPSSSVSVVAKDDGEDVQMQQHQQQQQQQALLPSSSGVTRRFQYLRAISSSSSSSSCSSLLENSLLWPPRPSETERTVDVDPTLTEPTQPQPRSSQGSQPTPQMSDFVVPTSTSLRRVVSSDDDVERAEEEDDVTIPFSSAHDHISRSAGQTAAEDAEALRSSTTGRRSSTSTPHSQHGDRTTGSNSSSGSQRQGGVNVNDRSQQHVQQADESKQHQNDARDQPETDAGGEMRLTDVEELSDRDVVEAEEDEHEEGEEEDGGSHSSHSSSTHDEGVDSVDEAQLRVAAASADPRSDETAPPTRQSQVEEEEAEAAAAIPSAAAATPAAALPAVVVAESAIDDASLHLVSRDEAAAASTSVDEGSHMSVPSSNVFSGISTSNRTAVHPNLPAVLTLTSPASLGAASLFIPSNPQLAVPLSRQQQLHTVALQSAYTIHHSTTEEGSLGVAPVSDFEPGRFGAVKDELLSNYATHHSTEDTLGIGDGGGGGDGGDGGGCGHCMGPETSSLPRDAFDALDVIGQPTRTMEHAREVVEIALEPEADEAADVKKGSSGSAGQEASVASLQKDPTPGTAGAAAVEREQSEAAAAPAVETAAASGKGTESTESSPHQVAEAEENSKKSHEHARPSSDVEAVDVERAVPHDDFSEHQQRAPPRQPQPQPQPLLQPPPPQEVLSSGKHTFDLLFPASTPEGATSTAASNANGEKSDNNVAAPSDRAAALVEVPLMPMSDGPGQKGTPVLVSHPLAPQPEQWSADTKPAAFDEVVAAASSTQRSASSSSSSSSSSSPSMPAGTTQASAEAVVAAGASADPKNYADEVAEKEEKEKEGRRSNAVASGDPRAIHAGVAWRWPSHAATASAPTPGSPLDKLLSAVDTQALTRPEPPPPQQLRHQEAGSFPSPRRLLIAQDFLEDVEQLSDMEAQQEEAEGEGEAQWGGGQLDKAEAVGARNARRVSSYHTDLVGEYVQECRSAAAAADLAVVQELEREDRRRLLSAMLVERELIFREEAAAFTVVSFMTAVRGHERGKKTPHRNIIRTADENTSVHELPQQQPPRDARRRKKKALLPPSPPAPTSRQEVQELLRTRGLLRGGVSSLGLVSAAVFTDELLHREVIEDDEVRARTMLRRLRQCEMDALFPFSLFMQETLAWQRITEEEQMERQRVRALDVVVNEEMADLLNASRELAMCYAMEEEERVEVIERAEEAGRQRLYELHRSGLAARLRQRALLLTSLHLELADALEDLTFDESQAREELRVEAIREWTMLLESASGTAVLAHARAQQQRQERKRETHAHRGRHSRRAAQAPSSSSPPRDLHERQTDTHKKKKRQQEDQQLPSDAATMHVAVSPRDPVSSSAQLTAAGAAAEAAEAINEEEVEEVESMRHVDSSDTSPSSSESSTRSSSSSSSSVSISIESELDDHHHHDRPGLDVAPVFFQWDPTSNSNPSPPQSSPSQRRQPHEHPPQPQLSSSSPSPHLTNMTTFTTTTGATTTTTTTTTINTSSSSMLVGQQQGVARATVSSGATHASTVSRRSPTLVLPAKQRWATAQQTEDGIGPAEASALLHALHCAEEDTRQAKRAPSAAAAAAANLAKKKSREEKRAAEGDARRSRHNTADEGRREDSALYKAKQRAKTSEVVNERGDEVAATTRVADAAGAASGERARHDRRTSPASPRRSPLFITRHTIPCSLQRSPSHNYHALLRKYASPVDSSSSPPNRRGGKDPRRSSTAKLLLAAGARALMSPSFSPISPRPYDDREVYAYDPQRARRHTSSPRAGARVADKQLRVPWDHTTYTDSRFNAMADSHTPAEERNTNQQQLPHHRLLPGVDEKEQLPHEQTMAEVTAAGKASSASTLTMLTPAREVFPPHRTSTLDININNNNNDMIQDIAADDQRSSTTSPAHPRPRTRGALLVSEYVPAERTPLTQQELAQPTVIEVITDTCVPSARDVSLSPLSSAVPSPPRPPLAYAAPTAAWTMQVEQRQQDRLRSMLRATQISSGNYATHVSNVLLNEEEKDEEGASMEPGGRSAGTQYDGESYFDTDSFTGDDACRHGRRRRLRSTEQLGCSRRRPQEPSGPLLITRLPFEQGPGVWPSAVNERARVSSPLRHCDNKDGGLAGPRSRGDQRGSKAVVNGITASPYSPHPAERHVILTTRPVSTSPSRLRTPPSPQQQQQQPTSSATLVSALKDAFTTALRSGDVVQLPTTVAELLRGPQHAHITLPLTTQADNLTNWNNDNGRGADDDNDNDDDDAEARADGTDGGCLDENQVSKAKGEETRRWRASNRLLSPSSLGRSLHNGNNNNDDNFGASRSSYNYVDVFFKQPRRESPSPPMRGANGRQSCTSPPAARTAGAVARAHQPSRTTVQQRFIAERCAAVQEREAQHGLRELLRPSLRTRQARSSNEAAAATLRPATLTADVSAAEGSSFIGKGVEGELSFNNPRSFSSRTRRTHAELINDDMQELDEAECFFDTADMVLCSALASQLKRERGTAQRRRDVRQQQQRQQQQQQQQKNVFLSRTSVKRHLEPHAARASLSVGSNSTHLQSLPQQRQQQQRDASPSTASSFGLDIPASYRIMRAPSPSYLQLRMPSQPPQRTPGPFSTPLSASAAAVAAAAAAGAAPGHPAAGSTTSHGYAAASSPSAPLLNPYDTHILYFNTNGLSSRPVRTGAA